MIAPNKTSLLLLSFLLSKRFMEPIIWISRMVPYFGKCKHMYMYKPPIEKLLLGRMDGVINDLINGPIEVKYH